MSAVRPPTGHVFQVERAAGPVWYAKYRLPDGRQVQKKIGPAWTERGRPAVGYFTKRTAEAWLRDLLDQARRGTLPGLVRTGATFDDAAAEWLRFIEEDRERKPSTLADYRSALKAHLLPAFGGRLLKSITPAQINAWRRGLKGLSNRSKNKLLIQLHGIFRRAQMVWGLEANPLVRVEKHPMRASGDIQVFSPEEVWALVRAAGSEQDGGIFLTAAFTGLRMGELIALRWRDVDFAGATIRVRGSYAAGHLTTPKSGKVRAVPMAPDVAGALAQLGRRRDWIGDGDLVFAGKLGGHLNTDSAAADSSDDISFEQTILANLRMAGIQNGRHGERLTFDTIEPYVSLHIQWVGERADATDGAPKRVGVTIGPQYGTVGPTLHQGCRPRGDPRRRP